MIRWILILLVGLLTTEAKLQADPLPADATIDQVLDALDAVGHELKDFTGSAELTEADYSIMDIVTYKGTIWFQQRGEDDGRIRVLLDQKVIDDDTFLETYEYRLQDGRLIDRDFQKKTEATRQVLKPGEKINLLKLGEGPFPLPIGQDKDEVHNMFDVSLPAASEDDLEGTIAIELKPVAGSQFAEKFYVLKVWVDRQTHMPAKIELHRDETGTRIQTTLLKNLKVNTGLSDKDFELRKINESEWSRHEEAYQE